MHITPLLPSHELEKLPMVDLPGTAHLPPATYTPLQEWLLPHNDTLMSMWWVAMVVSMAVVIWRMMAQPLLRGAHTAPAAPQPNAQPPHAAQSFAARYARFFSLHELRDDIVVRLCGGAVLLGFLATFNQWQASARTTVQAAARGDVSCWPFFQDCAGLAVFEQFPLGYSQMTAYMALFGLIMLAAYALLARRDVLAHACILVLFIAKIYFFLMLFLGSGNYDYYHNIFTFVFLFLPHKRFFASLAVAMFYVLSTVAKIHPAWTMGLYFTALQPGMAIFPKSIAPLMTNLVIFMEMIMAWFLFSRRKRLQQAVFWFFVIFHLYSGTIVGYHYPTIVMPTLLICFGPLFRPFNGIPLDRRSIIGWAMAALLWVGQLWQLVIPGDTKLTLEGNFYGLYMFEANHQCYAEFKNEEGRIIERFSYVRGRFRCDPYPFMLRAQQRFCKTPGEKPKISYYMIHSINGGPFYEVVNEKDVCSLRYKPFSRNAWIKAPPDAKIIGRARQNLYY